jgi:hypothetical protein
VKKILLIILWGVVMGVNMYAQGGKSITLEYRHSRRIPYNAIDIELKSENNNGKIYYIEIHTRQMEGSSGWEYSNTERIVGIDKTYFDSVYDRLLAIDYAGIIANSENLVGADGVTISLTTGTILNSVKITLWSPEYNMEERKTAGINSILHELFIKIGLEEWL